MSHPPSPRGVFPTVFASALAITIAAVAAGAAIAPSADGQTPNESVSGAEATPLPMQANCGDGSCSPPEDCNSCPSDCGDCCGNRRCEPPEDCRSCPSDCGSCCGNHRCEPPEDRNSCPSDCN